MEKNLIKSIGRYNLLETDYSEKDLLKFIMLKLPVTSYRIGAIEDVLRYQRVTDRIVDMVRNLYPDIDLSINLSCNLRYKDNAEKFLNDLDKSGRAILMNDKVAIRISIISSDGPNFRNSWKSFYCMSLESVRKNIKIGVCYSEVVIPINMLIAFSGPILVVRDPGNIIEYAHSVEVKDRLVWRKI